ncbi:hypothetical protein QU516_17600 (plasmid) [Moellerella wisconsensis]|uniref:hypothetical protein n=1 Tax=Moellerella wisconsensis TaxID=158849 RepID=UPI0025B235A2|nr:hypothetical protein [Moellerella wisconsensis]WJW83844.1 hypothetical protein QU516_17600 [Moellerella wisconsensis]
MRPNAYSHSHVNNLFLDNAQLEREQLLDAAIEKQIIESRDHLHRKIRLADRIRNANDETKRPSACEKITLVAFSLNKEPLYSDGESFYTLDKQFNRTLFSL